MTVWNEDWAVVNEPLAVLEWKVFRSNTRAPRVSKRDLEWLVAFSRDHAQFVGYTVSIDLAARSFRARVARCFCGASDLEWLSL